ncbi:MAG: HAD-IIB family hydrolase [Erysipelotrichaceae bacterium]|nr:HAD-IIB family hydrolase [Erysipelotrichaceae bacterium]MDY5251623.1 HAD-IIB family hydrolase [Erysipelotrichaceae bacterium]
MENKYKVIVVDMDGTLLNSCKEISKKNREVLINIQKKGIKVALASGRPLDHLMEDSLKIELDNYQGYLVGNNGQEFYDFKEKVIYRGAKLPQDVLINTINIAEKYHLSCFGLSQGYRFRTEKYHDDYPSVIKENKDIIFDKIGLNDRDGIKNVWMVANELKVLLVESCQVMVTDNTTIELVPFGIDKIVGVDRIRDLNNLRNEDILIIGDGENDYQMSCHYPFVAMQDCFDKLKEKAIFVTLSNDENGVAYALEKLCY